LFSFRAARRRRRGRAWNLLFWVAQRFSAAVEHLRRPASAPEVPSNRRQLLLLSLRMVYPRSLTMTTSRRLRHLVRALLPVLLLTSLSQSAEHRADPPALQPILHHISSAWDTLTRSMTNCETIVDPKLTESSVLYLPSDFPVTAQVQQLEQRCHVRIQKLPIVISQPGQAANQALPVPGLLYLEHPYVVPGGRFNEQYGWDSYFIVLGLLEDGRIDLARGMVENFFFEI